MTKRSVVNTVPEASFTTEKVLYRWSLYEDEESREDSDKGTELHPDLRSMLETFFSSALKKWQNKLECLTLAIL
jgi:hypothetical protein